jgi:crossover junction endodeoxyribonuclease RusA
VSVEISFPFEFTVEGVPVSHQAKRRESIDEWKAVVREASKKALPDGHFLTRTSLTVTLYNFPAVPMPGDIDNIVKPILDALCKHVYFDDRQVERVVVQKFDPGRVFEFASPSPTLAGALGGPKPVVYARISDDPFEDLK